MISLGREIRNGFRDTKLEVDQKRELGDKHQSKHKVSCLIDSTGSFCGCILEKRDTVIMK